MVSLGVHAAGCACAKLCFVAPARRLFLRKLKLTLKIPVLALVDSDPYGLKILSVYMKGSMNMSYDSSNLTTPGADWITGS
jgi:meiotic recombination protein SPO11